MKSVIITSVVIWGLTGCSSNTSIIAENKNEPAKETVTKGKEGNNLITFKINGTPVNTTGWTISRFTWDGNTGSEWLNITSNMHDEKRAINVNLNGALPGTYTFGEGSILKQQSHGSYYPDYIEDITNTYSFNSGSFIITAIDTVKRTVNGTFAGTVKNIRDETLEITDGKIENGILNTAVIKY
jgi:hypothetical protein